MFLNQMLEEYKESENNQEILNNFLRKLWKSKYAFKKYKKQYKFKIQDELLDNRQDLIELFQKYNNIEYIVCKSKYNKKNIKPIDYIRIHINNMYGLLFDHDVYYKKEYYNLLLTPKKEYFRLVNIKKSNGNIDNVVYEEIKTNLENALKEAESIKFKSINRKSTMKFSEYKKLINTYIERIFNNYMTVEEYENKNGWELRVSVDGWSEDNYVVKYFCKSLSGYMRNYIRNTKKPNIKFCCICNEEIPIGTRRKYCSECAKKIQQEQKNKWKRENWSGRKIAFISQYGKK